MSYKFGEPSQGGDKLPARNLQNHLVILFVVQYYEHVQTKYTQAGKRSDAVVVDVIDLTGGSVPAERETGQALPPVEPGTVTRRVMWMNSSLIKDLKRKVGGDPLLGTIGVGLSKGGNNPPFEFKSMTHDESAVAQANAWFEANGDFVRSEQEALAEPAPFPQQQQAQPLPSLPQQYQQAWGQPQQQQPPPQQQQWGQAAQPPWQASGPQSFPAGYQAPQQQVPGPGYGWNQMAGGPVQMAPAQVPVEQMTALERLARQHQQNPMVPPPSPPQLGLYGQPQSDTIPF